MTVCYLDTSAAMKLVVAEAETQALLEALDVETEPELVASWLLHTELHCAAGRRPSDVPIDNVNAVLDAVTLVDLLRGDLSAAGSHAPLRSADAVHLAVAIRLGVDAVVAYDRELLNAASRAGLAVLSPR